MATNDALLGRALAGRYRLQQRRGLGAHGVVLDAVDEQLQRPVAVKIMLPQFVDTQAREARFRLEAQVAGSLTHPNLNTVYDWGVEEVEGSKVPYLVLEHLNGGSLRDMLDRGRLLTPSQALMVGLDACRGLDYMHRRGVIHRDLKPANLAFGDDRHLRILDVGISRMVAEQTWAEPTAAGIDAARYASPEQARGGSTADGGIDAATDIYSLCLVMIEAVTGQVPFASDSTVATLNARLDKLMPVSADFGPLASVLSRAGSARASDRYTAAEFGRMLVQAAEKLPRPAALPIVGSSDPSGGMWRPGDPTGPVQRQEPTATQTTTVQPVVLAAPPADPPTPSVVAVPAPTDLEAAPESPVAPAAPMDPAPIEPAPLQPAPLQPAPIESAPSSVTDEIAAVPLPPPGSNALVPGQQMVTPTQDEQSVAPPGPPPSPPTDVIPVLEARRQPLKIVMADADVDGSPHTAPPPPPGAAQPTERVLGPLAARVAPPSNASVSSNLRSFGPIAAAPTAPVDQPTSPAPVQPAHRPAGQGASGMPDSGGGTLGVAPGVVTDGGGAEPRLYDQSDDDFVERPRRRGRGLLIGLLIVVIAAVVGALVATRLLDEKSYAVPDLEGQSESVARNAISGNDWEVVVQRERDDEHPLNDVIRTDPAAGAKLEEGSTIVFIVSDGPTMSILPDVTGQTLEAARASLEVVKLTIEVGDEVFCESKPIGEELTCPDIAAGSVVSWVLPEQPLVAAGTEVMPGTRVLVTLSKGPAPRTLPNLKGLDEQKAVMTLTDLGLLPVRAEDIFSTEFAPGIVADQNLPEGTTLVRGDTVAYAVSQGPEQVVMPAIDGQTYNQLFAAIKAARLNVGTVVGPTDGSAPLTSVTAGGQPVVAGQQLPAGTAIDLTYTPPPETTVAPAPETTVAPAPETTTTAVASG